MHPHTHHTHRVFQLKGQAGAQYRRDLLFVLGMSLLFLPPGILLEFPQSHRPTTTTITATFIPASRKLAPRASMSSEQTATFPRLPPGALRLCPQPGQSLLRPGCPACWPLGPPTRPWPQARKPSLCVHPGAGEKERQGWEIPDHFPSRGPCPPPPAPCGRVTGEQMPGASSCFRLAPDLFSRPALPPGLRLPLLPPSVWGA